MSKTLIVYFSKSGTTKKIAEKISQEINAPLHEIITEKEYPKNYLLTIAESVKELKSGKDIALTSEPIQDFDSYERILIGFPIWCFTCPMAVVSFLKKYDFSDKNIYPFCTSGGSSCEKATAKIREICKNAKVFEGLNANKIDKDKVSEWLKAE